MLQSARHTADTRKMDRYKPHAFKARCNIGASIITCRIVGVPLYNDSIIYPKTLSNYEGPYARGSEQHGIVHDDAPAF